MVCVVNFGGQYAHLIARRVRELGVKSELVAPDISVYKLKELAPQALIFSGSPSSVLDKNAPKPNPAIYNLGIPVLGICYGHQLIAHQLHGQVTSPKTKQYGKENLKIEKVLIFKGISSPQTVWFSHGDQVNKTPPGFARIASTKNAKIAAMQNVDRSIYTLQFHPEVTHTPKGMQILSNFLFDIAKVKKDWNLPHLKEVIIKDLKSMVADYNVIMALSGGVDSLVAATLLEQAIGKKLYLVLIDTGLLRKNEANEVAEIVSKVGLKNFKIVNGKYRFVKTLKGIVDPEEKRKKIADLYFKIFEEEAKKIRGVKFLGQGTIYPDRVESAATSIHQDKIKSHHNVTLPAGLKLKIIEPLAEFYKDEVRVLGQMLGIPKEFLSRHPFPGPALAIRILGEVTQERLDILREVDDIFISELKREKLYDKVAQAFAALIPLKAVGVMGDARTYSYIVSLRSVDTIDFMTADWSRIPLEVLEKISTRIVNEVRGVGRVLYDITQKPPATIEYE